ncbi:uncharacterized protein LOC132169027 [Corylus avellana]|uniref:uncharacterized protein LOC132169027 n=1 Tax=Corylus avellana TaxID=13451 RepID=UPI00286CF311|nr:uncharacterized protein LOC132169027 [Corylus avellana]
MSRNIVRSLWRRNHVDWCCLDSSGASGGILIMWATRVVEKIDVCIGEFTIAVSFKNVVDLSVWAFAGVYGPNLDRDRSERSEGASLDSAMMSFSDFISEQGLMDLPLAGGACTWSVSQDPPLWSRIDRFLVSPELEAWFPGVRQKRLPRLCSDRFPIILELGEVSQGKRPFRFENMWLKADGFVALVKQWWDSYEFQGTPSFVFACKLKALKLNLKTWNEEVFGNIERNKRVLLEDLRVFDEHEESMALIEEELARKAEVVRELEKCTLMEEISWRQKSRVCWLKEGDKCTKFFHSIANSNRRFNSIETLMIGDNLSSNLDEISEHIVDFYQKHFTEQHNWRPLVDGISLDSISEEEASWLERDFEEEEVKKVVFKMNGNKASGPDGFSLAFFQACWDVVREDIMRVFSAFHTGGMFVKSLNASFISLIPKIPGATNLKDFRPISLVGGMYKIIAKVLANRLKVVLDKIISKSQNAFIKGDVVLEGCGVLGFNIAFPRCDFRFWPAQLRYLRCLFLWFEAASGLKVNLAKSMLIPVGTVEHVDLLAGGRVTLIKSTLANLLTYYLSLFHIPVSVARRIEKLQHNFLWGGIGEEFKYHLVKWSQICTPIMEGGLGIRNLLVFNCALLGKWLWRYRSERDAWWRVVVDAKYGSLWGGWCSVEPGGTCGVGIACAKDASIADNVEMLGGSIKWNVRFSREAHDWEVEAFASFFQINPNQHPPIETVTSTNNFYNNEITNYLEPV